MIDPSLEIQDALIALLRADSALAAIVGAQVFDSVPGSAQKPYVTLGQPQVLPDKADCIDAAEVAVVIHGWSAGPKSVEIKRIGQAIAAAVDDATLTLPGFRNILTEFEQSVYLDDPDPLTKHVAVGIRVLTEPAD